MRLLFPIVSVCLLSSSFVAPTTVFAQTDNPLAAIAKRLATGAPSGDAKPDVAAYTFKPTGKRIAVDDLVNTLGSTDEEKAAIRTLLTEGFKVFEQAAKKEGKPNDVAAAFTFFIVTHYTAATGKPVSDAASDALYAQVQSLFAGAEMKETSDADKQRFWETCVGMSTFTLGMGEAMKGDADATAGLKKVAAASFQTFMSVPVESVKITDKGIEVAGTGSTKAQPANLSYTVPAGFTETKEEGGVLLTRTVKTDGGELILKVAVMTGAAQAGKPTDLCQAFYKKQIVPQIPAKEIRNNAVLRDTPVGTYRRTVGNGLRCYMTGNRWTEHTSGLDYFGTSQEYHIYYVESGATWVPVFVAMTGFKGRDEQGILLNGGERYDWLEDVLRGLKGTPSGKPLFTMSDVTGDFRYSLSSVGPMLYSTVTGNSVGMNSVAGSGSLKVAPSGAFTYSYTGMTTQAGSGTSVATQKDAGKVSFASDGWGTFLIRAGKTFTSKDRIVSVLNLPDGRHGFVLLRESEKPTLSFIWGSPSIWITPEK